MAFPRANIKNFIKNAIPDSLLMHRLPSSEKKSVLLTFDDGPDPENTPLILDRLGTYDCQAIFFVVGKRIEAAPDIFDMVVSRGHIIGNHTYNHPNRIMTSISEFRNEILQCDQIIKERTGRSPQLVRPPLGLSPAILFASLLQKLKIVLWSIEGGEWGVHKYDDTSKIIERLNKNLCPQDILLLHDDNCRTIDILDGLLPLLQQKGINLSPKFSNIMP